MRLVDDIDHHGQIIDCLLRRSRYERIADWAELVLRDFKRLDLEEARLRRRLIEVEAELATYKPAPPPVQYEEYGQHIKWTGD